jgi:hypothetical protein
MPTIYLMERHDQLMDVWRQLNLRDAHVVHLDFHCDMRGLLVDTQASRAYRITVRSSDLDEGNFITYAIFEGRVSRLRWVHDVPGGRRDDVNGVKLATDLTASWAKRRLRRQGQAGIPFVYEAMTLAEWGGPEPHEFLDIDWDVFACNMSPLGTVRERADAFLQRSFAHRPEHVALCYSPGYSHPTRDEFEAFGERLAHKFEARIERLPSPPPAPVSAGSFKMGMPYPMYRRVRSTYFQSVRWLRYRGIY